MKIMYTAFIRLPTEKAHGAQIMKTCEAFAGEGVEVELVIPGRKTPVTDDPFDYYDVQKNFTVTKLKTPDWVGWGVIGFMVSALWFSEVIRWRKSFWNADIVYSRDAFVLLQYLFLGRKIVYEAHTKPTFISKLVAKYAYRLVVISEGLRDVYIDVGIAPEKSIVAHDAIDPESFKRQYDLKESREWLGIPQDKKIALYVGRIDSAKGADTFAAASEYVGEDMLCVLVGTGPLVEELQKKYPKARFCPATPYKQLSRVLAAGDVLVIPNSNKNEDASKYTSPMKAFAYLATGKPIVSSDVPALRAVLKENTLFFEPDDASSLAWYLEHSDSLKVKQQDTYTWKKRAIAILSGIKLDNVS